MRLTVWLLVVLLLAVGIGLAIGAPLLDAACSGHADRLCCLTDSCSAP